jgi:hypothetical protein
LLEGKPGGEVTLGSPLVTLMLGGCRGFRSWLQYERRIMVGIAVTTRATTGAPSAPPYARCAGLSAQEED